MRAQTRKYFGIQNLREQSAAYCSIKRLRQYDVSHSWWFDPVGYGHPSPNSSCLQVTFRYPKYPTTAYRRPPPVSGSGRIKSAAEHPTARYGRPPPVSASSRLRYTARRPAGVHRSLADKQNSGEVRCPEVCHVSKCNFFV